MKKWGVCVICILLLCVIETVSVFASEKNTQDYLGNMTEELDFSKLDHFMRQDAEDSGITFSELVKELLYQEKPGALYQQIGPWLMGQLCESVCENRKILVEVVLLAVCFSVLKNFAGAFASSYVSDLCFILVFCVLAVLMLQSFLTFREIVCGVLEKSVDFFQIFIPTFSIAMLFSAGESIASGFYQTAFLIIYLIEWLFLTILVPMIHIYILTVLVNYFFEEEKFANMMELIGGLIGWAIRSAGIIVLGLNVVQGIVAPAKDRLLYGTAGRAMAMIPGIGNTVNGVSELLLGSGIMIRNCVGAAGLIVLIILVAVPMVQAGCMVLFYKIAAAVVEPVADKRIAGCLKGMAQGGMLYLKLMGYCVMLIFLTIALTAASSGFGY